MGNGWASYIFFHDYSLSYMAHRAQMSLKLLIIIITPLLQAHSAFKQPTLSQIACSGLVFGLAIR